jgi:hypothetical protein
MQTLPKLGQRRTLRDLSQLTKQIIGERRARHRGSGFQAAMESIRDIANLYHPCHARNVLACAAHVNLQSQQLTCCGVSSIPIAVILVKRAGKFTCARRPTSVLFRLVASCQRARFCPRPAGPFLVETNPSTWRLRL